MPKRKELSPAAMVMIDQAVRDERQLWEHHRLEDSGRQSLQSSIRQAAIKKRQRAIEALGRIQQELSDIDREFFPLSKPLSAAVVEPIGQAVSRLMAPDERDKEIEDSLGNRQSHRPEDLPKLMHTLCVLRDLHKQPRWPLVRYSIEKTDLLTIPSADGLTTEGLYDRLRNRKKLTGAEEKS